MTVALAVSPLTMNNRDVCLIGHVRLIGRIRYVCNRWQNTYRSAMTMMRIRLTISYVSLPHLT